MFGSRKPFESFILEVLKKNYNNCLTNHNFVILYCIILREVSKFYFVIRFLERHAKFQMGQIDPFRRRGLKGNREFTRKSFQEIARLERIK